MSRYIEVDKIKYTHIVVFPDREDEHSVYKSEIDAMPTADVVEVVRGEWYLQNYCYIDEFKEEHNTKRCECSVCHERPLYNEFGSIIYSEYCPHCGAKMEVTR